MFVATFKPENVAGKIECADLPAAVSEHLVGADAAAHNFI
jgi:hypothetical protein